MHAFFPPFGILPNNAIVGGSADIATGAALLRRLTVRTDWSFQILETHPWDVVQPEAMNFASVSRFHELWDESMRGGLPIIFNFMNNFYGMGGQTAGETMAFDYLARVGAGEPDSMHAERVDGYNPLAVADAIRRKRELIEKGEGPILLETITYRYSGHSPSDASSYRIKEEIEAWQSFWLPINAYAKELTDAGLLSDDAINSRKSDIVSTMTKAFRLASDLEVSPRLFPLKRLPV